MSISFFYLAHETEGVVVALSYIYFFNWLLITVVRLLSQFCLYQALCACVYIYIYIHIYIYIYIYIYYRLLGLLIINYIGFLKLPQIFIEWLWPSFLVLSSFPNNSQCTYKKISSCPITDRMNGLVYFSQVQNYEVSLSFWDHSSYISSISECSMRKALVL